MTGLCRGLGIFCFLMCVIVIWILIKFYIFCKKSKFKLKNNKRFKIVTLYQVFFLSKDWSTEVMKERWTALWVKRKEVKQNENSKANQPPLFGGTVSYTAQPAGIVRFCSGISRVFHPAKVTGTVEPSLTLHLRGAFLFKWSWQHFGKEVEVFFLDLAEEEQVLPKQLCPGQAVFD